MAHDLKMLSANQINAQVKLTEMWKASNVKDYPIKLIKKESNFENMSNRSTTRGDLVLQGKNELCNSDGGTNRRKKASSKASSKISLDRFVKKNVMPFIAIHPNLT